MSSQLALKGVSKSYDERVVLHQVSLTVRPGEHVGLVGENGSGKSTLLRLIAGMESPTDGEITVMADGDVGYLGQTLDLPGDSTVQDTVDWALADLRDLERRMHDAEATLGSASPAELEAYGRLQTLYETRGGYEADARVRTAMDELGLSHLTRDRTLDSLAGGEQARLALACVLAAAPDLLLLDEPTNHLDDSTMEWLENRIRTHPGSVIVVSHDRTFLERTVTAILEVDGDRHKVERYGNGYEGFLKAKAAARQRWEQEYADWLAEIDQQTERKGTTAHRVGYARRYHSNKLQFHNHGLRAERQVSSRVRNAEERIQRLRDNPVPRPPDPLRFTMSLSSGRAEGTLVAASEVVVADRLSVRDLTVTAGQRILICGANGAGKTTLLQVVAGVLEPDAGTVERRGRIGYLPQEVTVSHPRRELLTAFGDGMVGTPDEHAERLVSFGLFRTEDFRLPVGALSVGQQRRLVLARLLARETDLLLLDEPTNHLSLTLVEELEEALAKYDGAVVVVSHDRRLRSRFIGRQYEMRGGRLEGPAESA